jgi:opacity protein-like surface antigen
LNLAGSVFYTIGGQKAGEYRTYNSNPWNQSLEFKLKNTWGISIEPGYNLNGSALVYAKLGYVETKGDASASGSNFNGSAEETLRGYSYGAGVKYKLSPNLFAVAEIQQSNFKEKPFNSSNAGESSVSISFKPNSLTGVVGIGYKF